MDLRSSNRSTNKYLSKAAKIKQKLLDPSVVLCISTVMRLLETQEDLIMHISRNLANFSLAFIGLIIPINNKLGESLKFPSVKDKTLHQTFTIQVRFLVVKTNL